MKDNSIEILQEELRAFADEREWDRFHSPKNLAMALSVEVAELVEIFQWLPENESEALSDSQLACAALELADIFIYLIRIADKLKVDLIESAHHKVSLNKIKYPADEVRGDPQKRSKHK